MTRIRSILLALVVLVVSRAAAFADQAPLPPELLHALVSAKSVYIVTGHVKYFKTKAFVKSELVDSTPFAEPTQKEVEQWGRFKIVSDPKDADIFLRVYRTGSTRSMPVSSQYVSGSVSVGSTFTVLDVIQPASKKTLWFGSKNDGRTWSTKTAVAGLVKQLREFLDQQEQSSPAVSAPAANSGSDLNGSAPVPPSSPSAAPSSASASPTHPQLR
jgi:hypothetical protein